MGSSIFDSKPLSRLLYGIIAVAAAGAASGIHAQSETTLAARIQRVIDRPEFRHAIFGIEFYSLDSGRPIYVLNEEKLFTPGSTTKLLTEGTALELLGADFRFHTRVYRAGDVKPDGTLDGDLVLVASGDPDLSARVRPDGTLAFENEDHSYDGDPHTRAVPGDPLLIIRELAAQVAQHGIKRITGRVRVDASLFAGGDRELGTGVVISPIVVNDNLIDLMIGPGSSTGSRAAIHVSPVTAYAHFVNEVTTSAAGSKPELHFVLDAADINGFHAVTVSGSTPAGQAAILYSYAVSDPERYAQVTLAEALREKGIVLSQVAAAATLGDKTLAASYVPERVVAEHISAPLKEGIRVTLKVSQNLHASMMPRTLKAILAPKDTGKTGFDLEHDLLTRAGLDLAGAQQADGAGGDAHFSPAFMVSFLAWMSKQKDSADFHHALPILGRDGTLWNIQPSSPAAGHAFAKTGTFGVDDPLNRRQLLTAKALAGYITTRDNRHLAFAVFVNNVSVSTEPNAATTIAGQAVGEIAAAAYESP